MRSSSPTAWLAGVLLASGMLLAFGVQAARDPFAPPANQLCDPAADKAAPPQLRGIIGGQEDYRAWLVADSGKGRLWRPLTWPHPEWQLREVNALGISWQSTKACRAPFTINLAGSSYGP